LIKIVWAYMVFSQSGGSAEKEFKFEHKLLWEKLVELLNKKVSLILFNLTIKYIAITLPN
jgi:hypothetical protein